MWLHAAGFAPMFQQRALQDEDMAAVREALTLTIKHHEPYPAMVVNRQWDMLMCNAPAERFVALLGQPDEVWQRVDESGGRNVSGKPAAFFPCARLLPRMPASTTTARRTKWNSKEEDSIWGRRSGASC